MAIVAGIGPGRNFPPGNSIFPDIPHAFDGAW